MSENSNIQWTHSTVQPMTGCTRRSEGCNHCYAIRYAWRLAHNPKLPADKRAAYAQAVKRTSQGPDWSGEIVEMPGWRDQMAAACRGRIRGRRTFVESMGDLFHERTPDQLIREVVELSASLHQDTGQVFMFLTKRPGRMAEAMEALGRGKAFHPGLWMGATVESPGRLHRLDALLAIPAERHFVSLEPLLGPVNIRPYLGPGGLDWVIAGGETGPNARPTDPTWLRQIRDQCRETGTPFFLKHLGEWAEALSPVQPYRKSPRYPRTTLKRVGKEEAGRELDGRLWEEIPGVAA